MRSPIGQFTDPAKTVSKCYNALIRLLDPYFYATKPYAIHTKKMLKTYESGNLIAILKTKQLSHLHHFLCREEKIKRRRTLKQTKTTSHSLVLGDLNQRTSASTTSYFIKANNFIRYFEFFRPCCNPFVCLRVKTPALCLFVCFLFSVNHFLSISALSIFVVKHLRGAKTDCVR